MYVIHTRSYEHTSTAHMYMYSTVYLVVKREAGRCSLHWFHDNDDS